MASEIDAEGEVAEKGRGAHAAVGDGLHAHVSDILLAATMLDEDVDGDV